MHDYKTILLERNLGISALCVHCEYFINCGSRSTSNKNQIHHGILYCSDFILNLATGFTLLLFQNLSEFSGPCLQDCAHVINSSPYSGSTQIKLSSAILSGLPNRS